MFLLRASSRAHECEANGRGSLRKSGDAPITAPAPNHVRAAARLEGRRPDGGEAYQIILRSDTGADRIPRCPRRHASARDPRARSGNVRTRTVSQEFEQSQTRYGNHTTARSLGPSNAVFDDGYYLEMVLIPSCAPVTFLTVDVCHNHPRDCYVVSLLSYES